MPKVRPLTEEQLIDYEWEQESINIMLDCKRLGIKNKDLAKLVKVTPEAISKQFSKHRVQKPTEIAYKLLRERILKNEKND